MSGSRSSSDILRRLTTWLYPPTCVLCGGDGVDDRDLCAGCHAELPHNRHCCAVCALPLPEAAHGLVCGHCSRKRPLFDRCLAALHFTAPADELVHGLKYRRRLNYARLLGALMADYVEAHLDRSAPPQLLIPVPLHPRRLRERGFNQAIELARPVAGRLELPLAHSICRRTRPTPLQTGLTAVQRRRNLRHAFALRGLGGARHVAIVDDVMTTGSTANELARLLIRHGVERIEIWAACRTPHPHDR